jgi:hypothetical protein
MSLVRIVLLVVAAALGAIVALLIVNLTPFRRTLAAAERRSQHERVRGQFTATQIDVFDEDLRRSREISLEEWQARPISEKITDWLASALRSQL